MKFTLLKTSKQNKQSLKLLTLEQLVETAAHDTPHDDVERLRSFMRWAGQYSKFSHMYRLPVVYPAAELRLDTNGNTLMRHFNGVLTLSVGPLADREDAQRIKQAARMLPMTLAVVLGSSGRTVKILAAVSREDGTLPQLEHEAERLCQQAYPLLCRLYQVVVSTLALSSDIVVRPSLRKNESTLLRTGFRMTVDDKPLLRQEVMPLRVSASVPIVPLSTIVPARALPAAGTADAAAEKVSEQTQQLIRLLSDGYDFRINRIMGYPEYRSKKEGYYGWQPVDEAVRNSLAMKARLAGLNVWDKDVSRYLHSDLIRSYNPVDEYLWELHGQWDGQDHIGRLARCVPTRQKLWPQWFRIWFLAMVAQWLHRNPRYGNALAPLLISQQGYNKSTFCRSLLPPELQWGYNDNLVLAEKKAVLQAMGQFLLINLDEFNQISPHVQEGFLKNLIQLASVKVKPPYGRRVEEQPRMASFIATANVTDILSDPSGNRRFIGIELTGPIDLSHRINHRQLYAQALALLDRDEPYWLNEEQTRQVMEANQQFRLRSPEELYFDECFRVAAPNDDGQWLTAATIFQQIKKNAGSTLRSANLLRFSRFLATIPDIARRRTRQGSEYFVIPR